MTAAQQMLREYKRCDDGEGRKQVDEERKTLILMPFNPCTTSGVNNVLIDRQPNGQGRSAPQSYMMIEVSKPAMVEQNRKARLRSMGISSSISIG